MHLQSYCFAHKTATVFWTAPVAVAVAVVVRRSFVTKFGHALTRGFNKTRLVQNGLVSLI